MKNRLLWLGILVMALVFGMTVVGCDNETGDNKTGGDGVDSRPFLSGGLVEIDITRPVVGETLTATHRDGNGIGTATWEWIRGTSTIIIGANSNSYKTVDADVGQTLKARVSYSGNQGSQESSSTSPVIGIPSTASVSVSLETIINTTLLASSNKNAYYVNVYLTLSDGVWDFSNADYSTTQTIKSWVSMSGTPSITVGLVTNDQWSFTPSPLSNDRQKLRFQYYTTRAKNADISISGLTVNLEPTKLTEMKTYTNVTSSLSSGISSNNTSSAWIEGTGY